MKIILSAVILLGGNLHAYENFGASFNESAVKSHFATGDKAQEFNAIIDAEAPNAAAMIALYPCLKSLAVSDLQSRLASARTEAKKGLLARLVLADKAAYNVGLRFDDVDMSNSWEEKVASNQTYASVYPGRAVEVSSAGKEGVRAMLKQSKKEKCEERHKCVNARDFRWVGREGTQSYDRKRRVLSYSAYDCQVNYDGEFQTLVTERPSSTPCYELGLRKPEIRSFPESALGAPVASKKTCTSDDDVEAVLADYYWMRALTAGLVSRPMGPTRFAYEVPLATSKVGLYDMMSNPAFGSLLQSVQGQ